ncbi:unnamed protein product [Cylindrotheca closterium]|uniref:G-protein coupled receptors family 1 profile domain-containing protein n=1 Tax=Cylindrotheca closterium TaxID=2856 RepID=A0AAD2CR42_9STRA|nr:unnamed protein product [Cylindrotheca closterium]
MIELDEINQRLIPSLSDEQVRLLSLLYVVSGALSTFGSFIIVHRVLRNQEQSKSYDRIMLGLSCSDIIASLSYILTPFLAPQDTSTRVTAMGNDVSCSVLGWLTQLGYSAIPYNAVLSFYMLAVVRFSMRPDEFAARFEPYLHALTVFYFLATATIGVPFHLFSELRLGLGCWIAEYPRGCDTNGGCLNNIIGWFYIGAPLLVTFASLVVNSIVIFLHSKRALQGRGQTKAKQVRIRRVATQGFLPMYLQLRHAGVSRGMAIRGACLEPDIPKLISEKISSSAPADPVVTRPTKIESSTDNNRPVHDSFNDERIEDSGTDDGSSKTDGVVIHTPTTVTLQPVRKSILKTPSARVGMDGSIT